MRGCWTNRTPFALAMVLWIVGMAACAQAKDFFAATNGLATNDGSILAPWDLKTALTQPNTVVQGGDTIWVRGGTYAHPANTNASGAIFGCTLQGNSTNPIKVRNCPGERVILDGTLATAPNGVKNVTLLRMASQYTWYMGLELTNSDPVRVLLTTAADESNRPDRRGNATDDQGPGNKMIGLIIKDTGGGVSCWSTAPGGEYHGMLVFNNGWAATDRGHGHGIYSQNTGATKRFMNGVYLPGFGNGGQVRGSDQAYIDNYHFEGNVIAHDRFLVGEANYAHNHTYTQNYFFGTNLELSYSGTGGTGLTVTDNWLANGIMFANWTNATVTDNRVWNPYGGSMLGLTLQTTGAVTDFVFDRNTYWRSSASNPMQFSVRLPGASNALYRFNANYGWNPYGRWQEDLGYDLNGTWNNDTTLLRPTGLYTYVRPNAYNNNRANLVIFNWEQASAVAVNIASLGWSVGDQYELRYAPNYHADVVAGSVDATQTLNIAMTGHVRAQPIGYADVVANRASLPSDVNAYADYIAATPSPQFATFVLVRTRLAGAPAAPTNLDGVRGDRQAKLVWLGSEAAGSYSVKMATTAGGPYTTVAGNVAAANYTVTGLTNGVTYYFVVTASGISAESGISNEISVTPLDLPAAPAGLTATPGSGRIALSWSPAARASTYNVRRSTTNGGPYTTIQSGLAGTAYLDIAVADGTRYYYVVSASNISGEGPDSSQAAATPNAAYAGSAIDLDGTAQYVNADASFSTASDWTVEAWIRTTDTSSFVVGDAESCDLRVSGGKAMFTFRTLVNGTNTYYHRGSSTTVSDGLWHHIVGVRSGSTTLLYVDGAQEAAGSISGTAAHIGFQAIGYRGAGTGTDKYFAGAIDEVRCYTRALSATEIAAHYNNGLGQYGTLPDANLVGGWHFDEASGNALDYSGNNRNGTLVSSPSRVPGIVPPASLPDLQSPTVLSAGFDYLTAQHKLVVQFSENVQASLAPADVQITDPFTGLGTTVSVSGVSYDSATHTATFMLSPASIPDGNYRATLLSSGISDGSNALDGNGDGSAGGDYAFDFFHLSGDANRDRVVDVVDLGVLSSNWQASPRSWAEGDFNYDGLVDVVDLGVLASNWQASLATPPAPPAMAESLLSASVQAVKRNEAKRQNVKRK